MNASFDQICRKITNYLTVNPKVIRAYHITPETILMSFCKVYQRINADDKLFIDLNDGDSQIQMMKMLKLSNLEQFTAIYVRQTRASTRGMRELEDFIINSSFPKLSYFQLGFGHSQLEPKFCLSSQFLCHLGQVVEAAHFIDYKLTTKQFCEILKCLSPCKTVRIRNSMIIDMDQPFEFVTEIQPNVNVLDLSGIGASDDCDWYSHPDHFERMLEALANSGFQHSLKEIDIAYC